MRVDDYCWAVIGTAKPHPAAQAVLWAIAKHVNRHNGETFVSLARIAQWTGISLRHVQRVVAELAAGGVFAIEHRRGRSSIYRFPLSTPLTSVSGVIAGNPRHPAHRPLTSDASTPDTGVVRNSSNRVEPHAPLTPRLRPEIVADNEYIAQMGFGR